MKLSSETITEWPDDAVLVNLDDPDDRDFWAGWFDAGVEQIELGINIVGPDLDQLEAYFVRHDA